MCEGYMKEGGDGDGEGGGGERKRTDSLRLVCV